MDNKNDIYLNNSKQEQKKSGNGLKIAAVVMASCALLLGAGSFGMSTYTLLAEGWSTDSSKNSDSSDGYYNGNLQEFEEATISGVVEKVTPAVVSILTETQVKSFFGQSSVSEGAGTGMIVTADGYVITNNHVIDGADTVAVVTDSGDTYENVKVVGVDPLNDVAYLKISGVSDLPTVTLGDSKAILVGQPVLAIGNALGVYQNSVSQGIVSGTSRTITASDSYGNSETLTDMIQTDAAINPGNSGGPLVNAAGEVVGMNTAVSTDAQGLGFAIPISSTKGMLANIINKGEAKRSYLGVSYLTITAEVAKEYDLIVKKGAYVYSSNGSAVVKGSPAEAAGVENGDIVTKVNGVEVGEKGSVASMIGEYAVGEKIELTLLRGGKEMTVKVTLGAYPES